MTELIEIRPLKTVKQRQSPPRSYAFTTVQASSSDSSEDENSSNEESPFILKLKPSKSSKRNNTIQTLPIILNTQPAKKKKKSHKKHIQQFLINTQPPSSPKKKEIVIKQIMEPTLSSGIQYVPMPALTPPLTTIIERKPLVYQRVYTPTLIEEHSNDFYSSYESPVRRLVRAHPSNTKSVHLPKHAKKLVNRFLTGIEHAHSRRYDDGSDSDCSIDDCKVCRRFRSAMNEGKRRSYSDEPHKHKHGHSKNCKVCNLLEESDFVISTTKDHSTPSTKKRGKNIHVVESFPSNVKSTVETTTTTTTTQPKLVANNAPAAVSSIPIQPSYYPMSYPTYVDPNTGLTYAYDPNWQYNPSATGVPYDYSSYYTNPAYIQNNPRYEAYNTTVPAVTVASNPTTQQQEHIQTTTTVSPNPLIDKGTYTYMPTDKKKHKSTKKTVVVHTSRNPTPPAPKIVIEQPRRSRLPRKIQSTTVLKERTTQTPYTTTTTYVRT
ncbi:unnamed protein product [Rotaria sp. Silwood1]|nr:unnamed protein product [Rotaria sp. Silwood1]CAF0785643.1 unnamed protein product [Rotaria sp. Silwood1]CAF4524453.1 unnamed protein product [Rotaria sp. Silwood1]